MKILILCTGNSCRSQTAAAFLRSFDNELEVYSDGTRPAPAIHPRAVMVMQEAGIDIRNARTHSIEEYLSQAFDYVITVCDGAKETCPVFLGKVKKRLHMGFRDPADAQGSEIDVLNTFRLVRDQIRSQFYELYQTMKRESINDQH